MGTEQDRQFYDKVYGQDFSIDGIPHGWIQWKGTRPCVDLHCVCGYHGHMDADFFFYYYECPKCHKKYALGQNIKLIELNKEQIKYLEKVYDWKESPFLSDVPEK